jgi:hypothetical protein
MPSAKYVTKFLETEAYLEGKTIDKSLNIKPRLVTVEEGDTLYIPPHWFHCVVPKDGEVGFTFITGFRSPWHVYGKISNYFVRRLYNRAFKGASTGLKFIIPVWGSIAVASHYLRKISGLKK